MRACPLSSVTRCRQKIFIFHNEKFCQYYQYFAQFGFCLIARLFWIGQRLKNWHKIAKFCQIWSHCQPPHPTSTFSPTPMCEPSNRTSEIAANRFRSSFIWGSCDGWWVVSKTDRPFRAESATAYLPTYLLLPREFISHVTNWKGRILSTGFFSRECISGNIRTYTGLRWFRVFAFKIAELLGGCFWEIWQNILGYAWQDDLSIWVFFSCQTSKQSQLSN